MRLTWISKLFSYFQKKKDRCRRNRRKTLFATTSNPAPHRRRIVSGIT